MSIGSKIKSVGAKIRSMVPKSLRRGRSRRRSRR